MKVFYQSNLLWRKAECLLRKTNLSLWKKKSSGQVDVITGMFLFVILVSVVLFGFQVTKYMITSAGVEDALAASNLASAIIDLEEYGKTHKISIPNPESAFALYREALSVNLELDENLNTTNRDFISSQVEIKQYIVYNLWEDTIEIFVLDGNGKRKSCTTARKGTVFTPDNIPVETTTIYSKVGFWVEGLMGQKIYAEKEKSIDITRCDSE